MTPAKDLELSQNSLEGEKVVEQQRPMQRQQAWGRQAEQQHLCTAVESLEDSRDTGKLARAPSSPEGYARVEGWWNKGVQRLTRDASY